MMRAERFFCFIPGWVPSAYHRCLAFGSMNTQDWDGYQWLSPLLPISLWRLLPYIVPSSVSAVLNFVHHSLTFKHFITTYVHLETILLVSFGAETVLTSHPSTSPPGQTTRFSQPPSAEYSPWLRLWPMGMWPRWCLPLRVWTHKSQCDPPFFLCLFVRCPTALVTVDAACWWPQPGSLNDCGPSLKVLLSSNTLSLWNLGSACFSRSVP